MLFCIFSVCRRLLRRRHQRPDIPHALLSSPPLLPQSALAEGSDPEQSSGDDGDEDSQESEDEYFSDSLDE